MPGLAGFICRSKAVVFTSFLLLIVEPGKAVDEGVGNAEFHQSPRLPEQRFGWLLPCKDRLDLWCADGNDQCITCCLVITLKTKTRLPPAKCRIDSQSAPTGQIRCAALPDVGMQRSLMTVLFADQPPGIISTGASVPSSSSRAAALIRARKSSSDSCGRLTSKRNPWDS